MVEKLRKRFILITMLSVIIVLCTIMTVINLINLNRQISYSDDLLDILISNGGIFKEGYIGEDRGIFNSGLSKETPYESRYFSVLYYNDKYFEIVNNTVLSDDEILQMSKYALNSNKQKAFNGKYRFKKKETEIGTLIVYLDNSSGLETIENFFVISFGVSIIGMLGVLFLVWYLSKKVFAPIEENMQRQKEFITDAGHELKTPLTIISANNEIIEMEHGESESTKIISKQVQRMTAMVKNLTSLAKLNEAQTLTKLEDMNLTDVIVDVASNFKNNLESKDRKFVLKFDENVKFHGDENLIRQLFGILFENASKYAITKTVFDMHTEGTKILIQIANDAIGVSKGDFEQCFERFYRSPEARGSSVEGSGVGLSIAKEIVELHKGTIKAFGSGDNVFNILIKL